MRKQRDTQLKTVSRGVGRPKKPSVPMRLDAVLHAQLKESGVENVRDYLENCARKQLLENTLSASRTA